jgi:hypothetical protein
MVITNPPKIVYDESGRLVEVFREYLRTVAAAADWETLPEYLQDAIDLLLIDEVRHEKAAAALDQYYSDS